jgi:membrane protease YdiL (CAAX protease family)
MASSEAIPAGGNPLWRKIVDFPLVAMVIAVALFILAEAIAIIIDKQLPPPHVLTSRLLGGIVEIVLLFAVYKLLIRRLGERPRDDLPAAGAAKGIGAGFLLGFLIFSAVVGIAAIANVYNVVGYGGTGDLARDLISVSILPGIREELFFRGILFRWIEEFGGSWAALLLTSVFFGAAHLMNPNATPIAAFGIAIEAGVLLGAAYMLTRSLWLPIGLHAAWNFTQGFIFDIPVSGLDEHGLVEAKLTGPAILSGGGFGLEASAFAMVIATAAGVWLLWLAIRKGELVQPWWVRRRLT